jgi:hypothetical protein
MSKDIKGFKMNCQNSGFQVKIEKVKKAAEFALNRVEIRRQEKLEEIIKESMKRKFWKNRTYEEAKDYVLSYEKDYMSDLSNWRYVAGQIEENAMIMLSAISVVSGTDFVWLTKDEASNVDTWLKYGMEDSCQ